MLKKQIFNFILVGILNTIVGYTLYAFFIFIGFHYIVAVTCSTILGILFNFKTISKFVFQTHDNKLIIKFFSVYVIVFIVNIIIIKLFKLLGFDDYIAGLIALFPCAAISFVLNKFYVYKK